MELILLSPVYQVYLSWLFNCNRFEGAPDSDTGGLNVSCGQQLVDNPKGHHCIRPLRSI